jgi:maltodextrin utilization protein YvdJ
MGPKKAAGGGKKKDGGGNPELGGELTPEMQVKIWQLNVQSLQMQLAERSEEASRALAAKRELQSRVEQIAKDFEEEQKLTFDITKDMTRQYKEMQEELLTKVISLINEIAVLVYIHSKCTIRKRFFQINTLSEAVQKLTDQLGAWHCFHLGPPYKN